MSSPYETKQPSNMLPIGDMLSASMMSPEIAERMLLHLLMFIATMFCGPLEMGLYLKFCSRYFKLVTWTLMYLWTVGALIVLFLLTNDKSCMTILLIFLIVNSLHGWRCLWLMNHPDDEPLSELENNPVLPAWPWMLRRGLVEPLLCITFFWMLVAFHMIGIPVAAYFTVASFFMGFKAAGAWYSDWLHDRIERDTKYRAMLKSQSGSYVPVYKAS